MCFVSFNDEGGRRRVYVLVLLLGTGGKEMCFVSFNGEGGMRRVHILVLLLQQLLMGGGAGWGWGERARCTLW